MKTTVKISFDGCREIEVDALPSDTVADVIAKIRTQEDIDSKIHLNLFSYSSLMNESNKISNFTHHDGEIYPLTLTTVGSIAPMKIHVCRSKKRIKIVVNGTDTIATVIKKVGAEGSIPIEEAQDLYFAGISMNNNHNLSYYGIGNNSEITVSPLNIFVKTPTGKNFMVGLKRSDTVDTCLLKIQSMEGIPADQQRLIWAGRQLEEGRNFFYYHIQNEAIIHLVLRLRGMISTFTSNDTINSPLVSYLMKSDEERVTANVPLDALRKKASAKYANTSSSFIYQEDPDLLHESQLDLLCDLIDFIWEKTVLLDDNSDRVDMRLTLTEAQLGRIMTVLDDSLDDKYKFARIYARFRTLFERIGEDVGVGGKLFKVALRATLGPTNSCIDFHCDGGYATSTSQIPLNLPSEYKGGQLCLFVNDQLHFVPRPRGSLVQHPPRVLHGVTQVTEGMRKSLFIVDLANGLGEKGVVKLTEDDVTSFMAYRALVGGRKRKAVDDQNQRK